MRVIMKMRDRDMVGKAYDLANVILGSVLDTLVLFVSIVVATAFLKFFGFI